MYETKKVDSYIKSRMNDDRKRIEEKKSNAYNLKREIKFNGVKSENRARR